MRPIHPAIRRKAEAAAVSMHIFFKSQRTKKNPAPVTDIIPIGILKIPDIRNTPSDAAIFPGKHPGRNIQTIRKDGFFVSTSIPIGVLQNENTIPAIPHPAAFSIHPTCPRRGIGILITAAHPEPSLAIKSQIDGLVYPWFRRKQLHLEPLRRGQARLLLLRRQGPGLPH